MTVATFEQPNHLVQTDATDYKNALEASIKVNHEVAGQFAAHEAPVPDMTVVIDAGRVMHGATLNEVAAQVTIDIVAPVADLRIDRIVIDNETGVYSIITGAEAVSPVAPAIPAGKVPCCQIALTPPPGETVAITNSLITDERVLTEQPLKLTILASAEQLNTNATINSWTTLSSTSLSTTLADVNAVRAIVSCDMSAGGTDTSISFRKIGNTDNHYINVFAHSSSGICKARGEIELVNGDFEYYLNTGGGAIYGRPIYLIGYWS